MSEATNSEIVDATNSEIVDAEVVVPTPATTKEDEAARRRRVLFDWFIVIIVALLVAFLVRTFVLAHFVVDGTSMATTLHDDDRVFVNKLSYRLHDPNRGDVVVLHQITGASERDLIKRVIGLPGETIEVRNCQVFVDGRALDEPYLDEAATVTGQLRRRRGRDQRPRGARLRDGRQPRRLPGQSCARPDRRGRPRRPRLRRLLADLQPAVVVGHRSPLPSSAVKASTITSTWSL